MSAGEIRQLTGLRFVAAFSILFLHTVVWCVPFDDTRTPRAVAEWVGTYGMPLFFVLSGFVIHYNYAASFRDRPYGGAALAFFAARFARIYPLYLFFLLVGGVDAFIAHWLVEGGSGDFADYVFHTLTLTQTWVYKIVHQRLLHDHGFGLAWSLSCEFFFYVAYAASAVLLLRLRKPSTALAAWLVLALAVAGTLIAMHPYLGAFLAFAQQHVRGFVTIDENAASSFYRWFFYFSPYVRMWEFALGCLAAQFFLVLQARPVSPRERLVGAVAMGVALGCLLAFGFGHAFGGDVADGLIGLVHFLALNFGCAIPLAVLIFCVSRYDGVLARLLATPAIVWLGEISYSLYAVHPFTLRPFIRPPMPFDAIHGIDAVVRVAVGVTFTLIVATATYRLIERPCRQYLRARLMVRSIGKQPVAVSTPG
jgi:peptidoglycan/LPS O-acetylase OafA/YrhL